MVHAKNYESESTLVKVMQRQLRPLFPDTVYYVYSVKKLLINIYPVCTSIISNIL